MENNQQTRIFLCGLSLFSFIPLIGVFIGLLAILIGLFSKFKNIYLIIIGACGIMFSVILYSTLSYHVLKDKGTFNDFNVQLAEKELTTIVKELEFYKIQNNYYPDSLTYLNTNNSFLFLEDPIQKDQKNRNKYFYYESRDSGYYLFSVGVDGIPFTNDDVLPKITCDEAKKIGILKCSIDSLKKK